MLCVDEKLSVSSVEDEKKRSCPSPSSREPNEDEWRKRVKQAKRFYCFDHDDRENREVVLLTLFAATSFNAGEYKYLFYVLVLLQFENLRKLSQSMSHFLRDT